ncbi:FPGT [Acanthosepion pharaonis]|uniref:FPGT n=1 Tax=Acanthosepion pharaonis TaxID=158019 RepID=A0A812D550_ACAPH|nr:FPGT [Sepia pharaonis]
MNEEKIIQFMRDLFSKYDKLRGNDKSSGFWPFWDAVVITTADEIQRDAYQSQIDAKKEKKELPINLEIYIVSDPPGPKLGNGGSTFTFFFLLLLELAFNFFPLECQTLKMKLHSQVQMRKWKQIDNMLSSKPDLEEIHITDESDDSNRTSRNNLFCESNSAKEFNEENEKRTDKKEEVKQSQDITCPHPQICDEKFEKQAQQSGWGWTKWSSSIIGAAASSVSTFTSQLVKLHTSALLFSIKEKQFSLLLFFFVYLFDFFQSFLFLLFPSIFSFHSVIFFHSSHFFSPSFPFFSPFFPFLFSFLPISFALSFHFFCPFFPFLFPFLPISFLPSQFFSPFFPILFSILPISFLLSSHFFSPFFPFLFSIFPILFSFLPNSFLLSSHFFSSFFPFLFLFLPISFPLSSHFFSPFFPSTFLFSFFFPFLLKHKGEKPIVGKTLWNPNIFLSNSICSCLFILF